MKLELKALGLATFLLVADGCRPTPDLATDEEREPQPAETAPAEAGTFAEVNGTRLFYEIRGQGESLVLIGGAHLDSRLWDQQVERFAEDFRVLRYDPRGIGRSELPQAPFSHYQDLHALLQFLGIERTNILAFSFGGGVALDFAVAHPQIVQSLILVAPGLSSWKDELAPVLAELSRLAGQQGRPKAVEMLLSDPSMPTAEHREAREKMSEILLDSAKLFDSDFAYLRFMEPLDPPAEERLQDIGAPTLLVVGERDHPGIHENVDTLQQKIAGAKKVLIMGVGHLVSLEKPDELTRILLDFLSAG